LSPDTGAVGRWAPVAAWAALIFLASTSWFAGPRTEAVVLPVLTWLFPHASLQTLETMHAILRKLGHFTEYLIFGLLIARALRDARGWRWQHALLAVTLAASYAVTDELHQRFVPGRTPAVGDVAIDAVGAIVGQIWLALRAVRSPRRSAQCSRPGEA
jgi:VanZ family protein